MSLIYKSPIIDWEEYVNKFQQYELSNDILFRGQSNSTQKTDPVNKNGKLITKKLNEWILESSFNRYYNASDDLKFYSFISQQLQDDLFRSYYQSYEVLKSLPLTEMDTLNKLYFLQHYGHPTCLIDFTKDPLIALYFSIASMKGPSGYTLDNDYNIYNYPDECFFSIYQIDCKILKEIFGIKNITHEANGLLLTYDNYKIKLCPNSSQYTVIGLLTNPIFNTANYNLQKQNGSFILYDNEGYRNKGLDTFLEEYAKINQITINEPAINIYCIRYNSIFKNWRKAKPGLFNYLKDRQIYGATLFNDLQGLKYDFNFFYQV